jgi:transglutaminase-like putative cysteine protease
MRWEIMHRTHYTYAAPVRDSFNEVRLQPFSNEAQTLDHFLLKVLPAARLRHHHDFYSNVVHHFEIPEPHDSLTVESNLRVTTKLATPLARSASPWPLSNISEATRTGRAFDFLQASRFVELSPEAWRLALDATESIGDAWQASLAIMGLVHKQFLYLPNSTTVHTHMRDVLNDRRGVCQDFAHVMIGMCRSLKIPALYVSGYLAAETSSATHAWIEVFIPSVGWRGLDPTHNRQTDDSYIKIAVGRDYADVPPITGNYRGTRDHTMNVEVSIRPI